MKKDLQEIKPGTGLGMLKFGMTREQVKDLLGEPDETEQYSYSEEEQSLTEAWHYDALELSMGFDEVDEWKMTTLSVTSGFYRLHDQKLIGLKMDDVASILRDMNIRDLEFEDWSSPEEPGHELVVSEAKGLNFWFENGILNEIEWNPIWLDEDTFQQPT